MQRPTARARAGLAPESKDMLQGVRRWITLLPLTEHLKELELKELLFFF